MKKTTYILLPVAAVVLAGCASMMPTDYKKMTKDMLFSSFQTKGIATIDRLNQDEIQAACSEAELSGKDLDEATRKRLEEQELAKVKYPANGQYFGDWTKGEKIAQSGVGMAWTNKADTVNGGNCYACHQLSQKEISYGTLGPSLYHYGKLRGNSDAIVKYTWGKLYNAKAYNACTNMPRFGHLKGLTESQLKDVMALLLDLKSPVNN